MKATRRDLLHPAVVVAALVAAAACESDGAGETDAGAQDSPVVFGENRIAYTAAVEGNLDIYVLSDEDSLPVRLTRAEAEDHWATWSPDGERIAFHTQRDGNREVYSMAADGSDPVNLSRNEAHDLLPAWSPDGGRIAFFSTRDHPPTEEHAFPGAIYVMERDGTNQVALTGRLVTASAPSWSPDGGLVLYAREVNGLGEIFSVDPETGAGKRLSRNGTYDGSPAFSPDGSSIAFYAHRRDSSVIVLMRPDGRGEIEVTAGPDDYYPSWSPDGRVLCVTGRDGEVYHIYGVRTDGSGRRRLTTGDQEERKCEWAPPAHRPSGEAPPDEP